MTLNGQVVSEKKIFENGEGRRRQRQRRTPENGYTINSPMSQMGISFFALSYRSETAIMLNFVANCTNQWVLELSFYEYLPNNGPIGDEEPSHKKIELYYTNNNKL